MTDEAHRASEDPSRGYRVLEPGDVPRDPKDELAAGVLEGLSERPKRLSSRFFYDDEGSRYFQQIMALPEYYPTRCETTILEAHGSAILDRFVDCPFNLVDLGAGDGAKTLLLLRHLERVDAEFSYVPIDISESSMSGLTAFVRERLPGVRVEGLVSDYTKGVEWLGTHGRVRRKLVLFLGSNIGNFSRAQARGFLRHLWLSLSPDDCVLIGFDLKKDIDLMIDAYNDSQGVTAAFNLNLLARINRELGGHFELSKFRYFSTYDVFSGAMESYLVSLVEQTVSIEALHSQFSFDAWEPVHTEYCYKYLHSDIEELAAGTGFVIEDSYYDPERWFVDSLWRVEKDSGSL